MRGERASRGTKTPGGPTPPQPITATDEPSSTGVAQSAAPAPVENPHAISHASSAGPSPGNFTEEPPGTIIPTAHEPTQSHPFTTTHSEQASSTRYALCLV